MGTSIHEIFSDFKIAELEKVIKEIRKNEKENKDDSIPYDPTKRYVSSWDIFAAFLQELVDDDTEFFKHAILQMFFDYDEHKLYERLKTIFNLLSDTEYLATIIYKDDTESVRIDYNKYNRYGEEKVRNNEDEVDEFEDD